MVRRQPRLPSRTLQQKAALAQGTGFALQAAELKTRRTNELDIQPSYPHPDPTFSNAASHYSYKPDADADS